MGFQTTGKPTFPFADGKAATAAASYSATIYYTSLMVLYVVKHTLRKFCAGNP